MTPTPYLIPSQHVAPNPMYYPANVYSQSAMQPRSNWQTAGSRGRPTGRDFTFGTPPDYTPKSPPDELMRRGRQRARSLSVGNSTAATVGTGKRTRGRSPGRHNRSGFRSAEPRTKAIDFAYAGPRTEHFYRHSRSVSHPRSDHRHNHRDPTPSRGVVSSSRPANTRRRSRSLPPLQVANNQGYYYYYPSTAQNAFASHQTGTHSSRKTRASTSVNPTGTNLLYYQAQPMEPPRKAGFFSRLFGSKKRDTPHAVPQLVRPVQPYAGYGPQGNAMSQMYSPLPATTVSVPRTTHRHRRRRSH